MKNIPNIAHTGVTHSVSITTISHAPLKKYQIAQELANQGLTKNEIA